LAGTARAGDPATGPTTGTVRGVVERGELDVPEAGRTVTLVADGAATRTTKTDAWGRFAFDGVAAGANCEIRVEAEACMAVRAPTIPLLPGETRDVGALWLGSAGGIDAFVADETGAPLAGATVEAFREAGGPLGENVIERLRLDLARVPVVVATTDAKGRALFAVARGATWTVAARAQGRSRVAFARVGFRRGPTELAFALTKSERLTGRVVDKAGRPVASAVVLARRSIPSWGRCGTCNPLEEGAALWQSATTDATGGYSFDSLPPGRIELLAAPPGGAAAYAGAVQFPETRDFDVELPGAATARGRVTDEATGAPIAGVVVYYGAESDDVACMTVTGPDGSYFLPRTRRGPSVRPPDGWTGARRTISGSRESEMRPGESIVVDVTLQRAAVVTGRVTLGGA